MLTGDQSDRLESLQIKALKTIYGWDRSYTEILETSGISTLKDRRERLFTNFAEKCCRDPRFQHWFPKPPVKLHDTRLNVRFEKKGPERKE